MLHRASFVALFALVACAASSNDVASSNDEMTSATSASPRTVIGQGADSIVRSSDTVFYTDFVNIEVRSVPVAGGASKVLWKGRTQPMDQLGDIALDERDLFFVEDGQILRIPQEGGRWDILVRNASDFPGDIDLDDRFVYWTSGSIEHAVIRRVAKEGGGATETIYDGPRGGNGISVKDGFVYFFGGDRSTPTDKSHYLMKVEAKPHGAVSEIARIENGTRDITVSGDEVFFANKSGEPGAAGEWGMRAVSKNGGAIRTVAVLGESNDVQPYSLRAEGNSLYWSQSMTFDWAKSPPGQSDAKIFTLATSGATPPKELATNLDGAPTLALSANTCPVWGGRFEIATVDHCK